MNELRVEHLCYAYDTREVLKDVSFEVYSGEYIYLLGANGVGKSTLFKCIMAQLKPQKGEVWLNQKATKTYGNKALAKKLAYISQSTSPSFNYSVLQTVVMGKTAHLSVFEAPNKQDYEKAYEILKALGLSEKANQGICEISGGERQLVLIARALMQEAEILILDEPTAHLDFGNQIRIQKQLKKLTEEGLLVIQASHNPQQAVIFGDKIVALKDGQVLACGKTQDILTEKLIFELYEIEAKINENMIVPIIK